MTTRPIPGLAFAHVNLRRNPFSQPPLDQWGRLAVVRFAQEQELVERLRAGRFVVQLMGECGRGKSTHMRALHRHFPDAAYVYLPEERPRPPVPREGPVVFVDETQRLSWWARRRLWRSGRGVVVGTHQDHSAELRRAGVDFEAITIAGLDAELLRAIISRRIEWARRGDGPVPWVEEEAIEGLLAMFGDDMRAIGRLLYELFQRMEAPGPVPWPPPPDVPIIPPSAHLHEGGVREIVLRGGRVDTRTS